MVNVHDHAHSLARALKGSPEYQVYKEARQQIKGNSSAEAMIGDFHQKQMEIQSLMMQGKEPSAEQKAALERLYGVIQTRADVRDYLMAEQRFGTLLNDIYKIIGDAVELELPGLKK